MKIQFKINNDIPEKWLEKKSYRRCALFFGLLFSGVGLLTLFLQLLGSSGSALYNSFGSRSPYLNLLLGAAALYFYYLIKKGLKDKKQKEIDSIGR